MNKKGQVWISVALYTALGIILIGLVLSVGMPFVNKVKMRNNLLQVKNVMYDMDNLIRETWNEGLGSRRPIFVEVQEGDFVIDEVNNVITWSVISDDKLGIEPGIEIHEGNLVMSSEELGQGYEITLKLDYSDTNVKLKASSGTGQLSGSYNLVVEHLSDDDCGVEIVEDGEITCPEVTLVSFRDSGWSPASKEAGDSMCDLYWPGTHWCSKEEVTNINWIDGGNKNHVRGSRQFVYVSDGSGCGGGIICSMNGVPQCGSRNCEYKYCHGQALWCCPAAEPPETEYVERVECVKIREA